MNVLLSVPPSTVRTVLHCFLYFEFSIHIVGFAVSAVFLVVFSRLRTIHVNLIWILDSFVLAFCITSAWRIYYCITLLVLDVDAGNPALLLGTDMRDTCMWTPSACSGWGTSTCNCPITHLREGEPPVSDFGRGAIDGAWIFSYLVVISLRDQVFTNFLAAFIFLLIYGISIALMFYVRKTNLKIWKSNRGKLLVSQPRPSDGPQSARFLYKCFVVFAGQTFIGWCCLVVYLIFKRVYQVPILEKVFGFVFDIMLASQTTAMPLTIVKYSDKLCMQFRRTVAEVHFYCMLKAIGFQITLKIWKSNRGKLLVSQNYQVHENVRSARFLYKCFVVFAGQTFIGWCCLVVYLIFKRVYQVPILEKVFGFVFDIMLASQTTAMPLTIVKYSDKLCMQFRQTVAEIHFYFRPNTGPKGEQRSHHLVDLEGRNLRIETREETKTYFDLFKTAWS
ncbi:hypothetical protein Q1695_013592 [Nippostrongylus brasiliensis]|nr:hypothetical protein Q1695_013592 [Nippostrongylus brasiliensis]